MAQSRNWSGGETNPVVVVVDVCSVVETRQIIGLRMFTQRKHTAVRTKESFLFWSISFARVDGTASSTGIFEGGFQTTGATIETAGE